MPTNGSSEQGMLLASYNLNGTLNWVKRVFDADTIMGYGYVTSLDISASGIMGVTGYSPGTPSYGLVGFTPVMVVLFRNTPTFLPIITELVYVLLLLMNLMMPIFRVLVTE